MTHLDFQCEFASVDDAFTLAFADTNVALKVVRILIIGGMGEC